jgi:hypothetical protein
MRRGFGLLLLATAALGLDAPARSQTTHVSSPLRSFDWTHPWKDPEPDNSRWTSPDGVNWTETFPSGRQEIRRVMGSDKLAECHGVVTQKTYPPVDEILIPDPGCMSMDLHYRDEDGRWLELGPMHHMSTADGPWSGEPTRLRPSVLGCTGWAEGRWDERVDVSIGRGAAGEARADWTPPHLGTGPMSLRLTYGTRETGLGDLKRVLLEGEPGSAYAGGKGYVTVETREADYVTLRYDYYTKPDPKWAWRVPLQADHGGAFHTDQGSRARLATALIASDETPQMAQRLAAIGQTEALEIVAFTDANGPFSHGGFDLSNVPGLHNDLYIGDRDTLFTIAYARAAHGLKAGCALIDSKCECGG